MKPKVLITHWVYPETIALLRTETEVIFNPTKQTWSRSDVLEHAKDVDGIMVFMPDSIDDEFLSVCPNLKVIGAALKGYDNFDVDACTRRNIWFTIVPDLLTIPTAELTIGLLFGVTRNILKGDSYIRSGQFNGWTPQFYGEGLAGKTIGIIGMGAVGRAIAKRLAGFDMQIVYSDKVALSKDLEVAWNARKVSLDDLLTESDFVVPMLPMSEETFHLINAEAISKMKPGAYLVNACRGSIVDEQAIVQALQTKQLAGYAADVYEMEEWVRPNKPETIASGLLDPFLSTVFTPHIGSAVKSSRLQIEREAAMNILQALQGQRPSGAINDVQVWRGIS